MIAVSLEKCLDNEAFCEIRVNQTVSDPRMSFGPKKQDKIRNMISDKLVSPKAGNPNVESQIIKKRY